jgi:hypothetical protein
MDETDGILAVGEVPVVSRRDPLVQQNHDEAFRSGQRKAFTIVLDEVVRSLGQAGPYDDTRTMQAMISFLTDRIKEVTDATAP